MLGDVMRGVWAPAVAGRPVVTRNRGRGKIVTPHLTYLYLTAECIVSVLRALIRQHGEDVGLTVVIAQRNARAEEYAIPIREHVAVTAYRLALSNIGVVSSTFESTTRVSPSLMVADHICYGIRSSVMAKGVQLQERARAAPVLERGRDGHGQSKYVEVSRTSVMPRWKPRPSGRRVRVNAHQQSRVTHSPSSAKSHPVLSSPVP